MDLLKGAKGYHNE